MNEVKLKPKTPLPWSHIADVNLECRHLISLDPDEPGCCAMIGKIIHPDDAAFIIQAVNAHHAPVDEQKTIPHKWHSIDWRIYGEGDGPAHFAEASNAAQAEQIVREHNELASTEVEDVAAICKFFSFATWALVLATVVSLLIMVRDVSVHDLRSAYDSKWFIVEIACAGAGVIAGALKKGVKSELTQARAALSTQGQK